MADLGSAIRAAIRQLEGSGEAGTLADEATIELDCLLALLTTAETERGEAVDRIQQVAWIADDYKSSARAAVARVEALSEALREIADVYRHKRNPPDWRLGYELARAALACPPQQPQKAGE